MRAHWFLVLVFGFTGGVAFRSFIDFGTAFTALLVLIATVLLFFFLIKREKTLFFVSLAIISIALGISRFDVSEKYHGDSVLDNRVGQKVLLKGVVGDEPDERIGHTNLIIDIFELKEADKIHSVKTRARITVDRYPTFEYGDEVIISGNLLYPKNFENEDTGKIFNYVSYLAKDGIFYQFIRPEISLIGENKGNIIKGKLFTLKHAFLENVSRVIPEPQSSLLGGLLVGAKQSLGEELLDDFRIAGVIHIVVLSGYNLTIVAEAIMRFFSFAPRLWGLSLGGISIILFSIMTGAGATVVRASIMALLALLARATGRIYEITLALLLAGFIMLLYNPKILVFDPSFQLSFLATLGLIHLSPIIDKFFSWAPRSFGIREVISATLATQLTVLPLLLFMMGTLSLVSLPVNLLILPLVPITMLFGFLAGVFGFLGTIASFPFAVVAYALLWYQLKVVEYAVLVPFSALSGLTIGVTLMLAMYAALGYGTWLLSRLKKEKA